MIQKVSYLKLAFSIVFIVLAVFGFTYSVKWYSEKYNEGYEKSGTAIDDQIKDNEYLQEEDIKSYTEMKDNASVVNNLLFVLFFLAVIVFLIFWLIIMLRRAILNN